MKNLFKKLKNLFKKRSKKDKKNLIPYGFKVYSQSDEDGIINEIFNKDKTIFSYN